MKTNFVHPLETAVEECLTSLAVVAKKSEFDSGTSYDFVFGETEASIGLPLYIPSRALNVIRVEFIVGRVQAQDMGKALILISCDLDTNRMTPLRVAARPAGRTESDIFLVFVCRVDGLGESIISDVLINGLDLVPFYQEMLGPETNEERIAG